MNLKLGLLFFLSMEGMFHVEGKDVAKNVQEFNALCRLFRIAYDNRNKSAEEIFRGEVTWEKVEELYASLIKLENETTPGAEPPYEVAMEHGMTVRYKNKVSITQVNAWMAIGRTRLKQLIGELDKLKGLAKTEATGVLESLRKALAGPKLTDLGKIEEQPPGLIDSGDANAIARGTACVGQDTGHTVAAMAGVSLSNDLSCLCVPADNTNTKKVCGFEVPVSGTAWQGGLGTGMAAELKKDWKKIMDECKGEHYKSLGIGLTPGNISRAIEHFNGLLGARVQSLSSVTGEKAKWILGVPAASAVTCQGAAGSEVDFCVNYAKPADGAFTGIQWREELEKAHHRLLLIQDIQEEARQIVGRACRVWDLLEANLVRLNISESFEIPKETWRGKGTGDGAIGAAYAKSTTAEVNGSYTATSHEQGQRYMTIVAAALILF